MTPICPIRFEGLHLLNEESVRLVRAERRQAAGRAALIGPRALSAPPAFKHMGDNAAFRFHDRFEESELSSAEPAVMV